MPDHSEKNTRRAIASMARKIREGHAKEGKSISGEAARKQAVDIAKGYDRRNRD